MRYGIYESEEPEEKDIPEEGIDYEVPTPEPLCSCGRCNYCLLLSEEDYK